MLTRGSGKIVGVKPLRIAILSALAATAAVAFQPASRVAVTAEALVGSAIFYHGKLVVVQRAVQDERGLARLAGTTKPVFVFWKERPATSEGEIRGEFWDLGRVEQGDSRFTGYDFTQALETVTRGRWPARDQIYVILGATMMPSLPASPATIRTLALAPEKFEGKEVRVVGRFKGRNLYGDLPHALGKAKWDFVLQSAEGAVWVTGMRPRGKGFDLDPGARVDTGRWLEVTGTVERLPNHIVYINATSLQLAAAPTDTPVEVAVRERPRLPPPEVIFSAPVADDHDVERAAPVRIQFSRDVDPNTVSERVTVAYVAPAGVAESDLPPAPKFTVSYNDAAHAIEIRFAQPLERFQKVRVQLLEGIMSLDRQTVKPWTLMFTTGAQ
jgi:hypothetical protein